VGAAVGAYFVLKKAGWNTAGATLATGVEAGVLLGGLLTPISPYWAETGLKGHSYEGITATGVVPREPMPSLFSKQALEKPWSIPRRLLLLQWFQRDGTIAADTKSYPFGTRMHIPRWGWGKVEDRGGAIQGQSRIDLYYKCHQRALQWGRVKKNVTVERYH